MSHPGLIPDTAEGRLEHLIEECSEVILAVQKLKRFGETHAFGDVRYDNVVHLRNELMDLEAAIARVRLTHIALRASC